MGIFGRRGIIDCIWYCRLNECDPADPVDQLKKQLADKDTKLTDVRLEALTSAHQVDQLKETVNRMRAELAAVKSDNERLTKLLYTRSRAGSQTSLPLLSDDNESVSECGHVNSDMSVPICVGKADLVLCPNENF